jgi:hypothetical protein
LFARKPESSGMFISHSSREASRPGSWNDMLGDRPVLMYVEHVEKPQSAMLPSEQWRKSNIEESSWSAGVVWTVIT